MPTDKKKTRKKRGHVSSGYGRVGKHRKHPGGRGKAGGQHHHKTLAKKFNFKIFGKKGIKCFHKTKQKNYCPFVNVNKIENFVSLAKTSNNLLDIGVFKLLGKGRQLTTKFPLKGKFFSNKAKDKIQKAGGYCIIIP